MAGSAGQEPRQPGGVPRRAIMLGAGGLAVGAVGAGIGLAAAPTSAAVTPAQLDAVAAQLPMTEGLMNEHGLLIRIILIYREVIGRVSAGQAVPRAEVNQAAQVIEAFIHGYHEPIEEGYVFPVVHTEALQSDIQTLLLQHARGREQTQLILQATAGSAPFVRGASRQEMATGMSNFVRGYEVHEAREDTVIYPAMRAASTPTQIAQAAAHFADLEKQQFGANGFQDMLVKVEAVEKALGIFDLALFTPPQV
jgi:hemerythrin-like domain-containing protein